MGFTPDLDSPSPLLPDDFRDLLDTRLRGVGPALILADRNEIFNGAATELAETWLGREERLQLDRYAFEKRRDQWLLGRICAKQSLIDLYGRLGEVPPAPRDIVIDVGASGRPFPVLPELPALASVPDISISHSQDKVIAMAATCRCGIDLQLLTETLFKVRDRFCAEPERALLHAAADDERVQLGLLWVAKEALRKAFPSPRPLGFQAMHLKGIRPASRFLLLDFQLDSPEAEAAAVATVVHADGDYCLGVCTIDTAPGDA